MDDALVKFLWGNEQFEEDYVTCPWCKYQDDDVCAEPGTYDYWECNNCGKTFFLEAYPVMRFTSMRNEEDMPEGWTPESDSK